MLSLSILIFTFLDVALCALGHMVTRCRGTPLTGTTDGFTKLDIELLSRLLVKTFSCLILYLASSSRIVALTSAMIYCADGDFPPTLGPRLGMS